MIKLKTPKEIEIMKAGGKILASVLNEVIKAAKPGASTEELTNLAEKLIVQAGGRPSFKNYKTAWAESAYPAALCVSINHEVVHGLPVPDRQLQDGDVVGFDCGLEYQGMYTDMAITVGIGKISPEAKKLIQITKECLDKGIKAIKPGKYISDIAQAVYDHAAAHNLGVVTQLVGHGVGHAAHEEPPVPNYPDNESRKVELKPGMCLALEPMINLGDWPVDTLEDGWTIVTSDKSLSAHFEHTVVVTEAGVEIITKS